MICYAILIFILIIPPFLGFLGIIPTSVLNSLYETDWNNWSSGFGCWFIIFIVGEAIIFFWNIGKLRNGFKIIELYIEDKKRQTDGEGVEYLYLIENKRKFRVDNSNVYWEVQIGRKYCFLYRNRKILELIQ